MSVEEKIPIIDITSLVVANSSANEKQQVAEQIGQACKQYGFFYIVGHGVDEQLQERLESFSKQFFALPLETKLKIKMSKGGIAWRGFFPLGGELTSGRPDMKEGIYFGEELDEHDPLVKAKTPLHGRNQFPDDDVPGFGATVVEYMREITRVGHAVLEGIALSLGLEASYFNDRYTKNPLQLFRIFHYPKVDKPDGLWGVGEHTDYGLLTILKQDNSGGLQVKSRSEWIEAPPVHNSFVCNIGDMLDRMTGGMFKSTLHRVKCQTNGNRLSYPFFFDPSYNAEVRPIEGVSNNLVDDDKDQRWDKFSVYGFSGTYGDYLKRKVSKCFPELFAQVI